MKNNLVSAFLITICSWPLFGAIYFWSWAMIVMVFESSGITLPMISYWGWIILFGVVSTLRSGNVGNTTNKTNNESFDVNKAWMTILTKFITQIVMTFILMIICLILI